jgi:hypothetical protein
VVSGGVLQLNKTNPGSGTAYAIGSVASYYANRKTNGSGYPYNPNANSNGVIPASLLIETSGVVELMQPNQLQPGIPVTIQSKGILKLDTGSGVTTLNNPITLTNGYIDVNTEELVLMASSMSSATAIAEIKSAYAGGTWSGYGITSSAAALNRHYGLAYSVDGSGDTTIEYDLLGDTNLDGTVNFADLLTLAQHYGQSGADWQTGDFFYTGSVNFADLLALAQNYGQEVTGSDVLEFSPSFAADWNLALAEVGAVPEPTSLGLLAIGAASLLTRRRKSTS